MITPTKPSLRRGLGALLVVAAVTAAQAGLFSLNPHQFCCPPPAGLDGPNLADEVYGNRHYGSPVQEPAGGAARSVASPGPAAPAAPTALSAGAAARPRLTEPKPESFYRFEKNPDGSYLAGFDRLAAFAYRAPEVKPGQPPPAPADDQIPAGIRALDGKKVVVAGFMLPYRLNGPYVEELLLMRDQQMCCYGIEPLLPDYIVVRAPKGLKPLMDLPVALEGTLKVGSVYENGLLTGIYHLRAEKLIYPR